MTDFIISECKKAIPCIDCDDLKCWFHGKKESDCPKYHCDNPTHDCENRCEFIDRFINDIRKANNDTETILKPNSNT